VKVYDYVPAKVIRMISTQGFNVPPGAVILAARWDNQTRILWHGAVLPVPDGTVQWVKRAEATVEVRATARDEEYNEVKP